MSDKPKSSPSTPASLSDAEIKTASSDAGRRTVLGLLGATAVGAASKALTGCVVTSPQPQVVTQPQVVGQPVVVQTSGGMVRQNTGLTDSDGGQWADPVGNGRGGLRGVQTGLTDGDVGQISDPVGSGRGHFGRGGASGVTDGDTGSWSDPVGNGRGTARLVNTGLTDGDSGNWSDPIGGGRGHR